VVRQPSWLNWLLAMALFAVFLALLARPARRYVLAHQWQPGAVVIGAFAFAATFVGIVLGAVITVNAGNDVDSRRNPPPSVVNPAFPDQESVQRGGQTFAIICAACHNEAGLNSLYNFKLGNRRDEEIFRTIMEGYGQMPPAEIPAEEAWDVVNFLRSGAFAER
jgi:mono/diheme cytochrome c family protein